MVISFEEKDRARIESTGMKVIEIKRMTYKLGKLLTDVWEGIKKLLTHITEPIVELAKRIHGMTLEEYQNIISQRRYKLEGDRIETFSLAMYERRRKMHHTKAGGGSRVYHCRNNC